jgi:hypothetical protein
MVRGRDAANKSVVAPSDPAGTDTRSQILGTPTVVYEGLVLRIR